MIPQPKAGASSGDSVRGTSPPVGRRVEGCQGCTGDAPPTDRHLRANDLAAIGVLNSMLGAGLKVPEDIAVVGYDDMPFAASETLSLTTMHQPIDRMATQCIDCLIARIQDSDGPGTQVMLSPHLVARRSTLGSKFDTEATQERQSHGRRRVLGIEA